MSSPARPRRTFETLGLRGALCGALVLSSTLSCGYLRIPREPMPQEDFVMRGPEHARGVIVLLPGVGDRPQAFFKQGFLDALKRHAPDYDVVGADAHFGYYRRRSVLRRLEADVIGPLAERGYRELWLVGASMGGHGAIAYARTHPEQITGLMLFAPYMGPTDVIAEVERAGGLCAYQDLPHDDTVDGFARANFLWLKQVTCDGPDKLPIWLAVGDEDRLLPVDRLAADALSDEHFLVLPGGHGWEVWTPAADRLAECAFSAEQAPPSDLTAP
jgi:hypothetical protein